MTNFIRAEVIYSSISCSNYITKINHCDGNNQVEDEELGIGVSTGLLLSELEDKSIKELAFLDPRNSRMSTVNGIINISTGFVHFQQTDMLTIQFQDFRACSDKQLPAFSLTEITYAIDYFWAAMAEVKDVSDRGLLRLS